MVQMVLLRRLRCWTEFVCHLEVRWSVCVCFLDWGGEGDLVLALACLNFLLSFGSDRNGLRIERELFEVSDRAGLLRSNG